VFIVPRNFYFGTDADIVAGSALFASMISASPGSFGLSIEMAESFQELNATLQSAFVAATNPLTRTPVAVQSKNLAIANMRARAILLAKIVYATETVGDGQLISLGLLPRPTRQPRAVPATAPTVRIMSVTGRWVKLRVREADSTRRGLPFGAIGCNVYTFVGPQAPTDPRDYHFAKMTTRAITDIVFPNDVPSGATVWVSAAWVNKRGKTSTGSVPMSFTLQGGPVTLAA
jgi:hypothetical protein